MDWILKVIKMWHILFIINSLLTILVQGFPELELTVEPQDTVVVPGNSALLDCAAATSVAGVEPAIHWRGEDGHVLTFIGDTFRSQLGNGSLYFSSVVPGQRLEGEYQCLASLDSVGAILSRSARLMIASLPQFEVPPAKLDVFLGQTAYFSCLVKATPPASVAWLKDNRPLRLDETRMLVLPSGSLEIDEVQSSDRGHYRCNATSLSQHRLSEAAPLTINMDLEAGANIMPPVFISTPRPAVVTEGSSVTLDCAANGYPNPWVTWLKDGITIDMADLDSRFLKVGTGSLQISGVKEEDQGTYQCRAGNRDDSVDSTATLEVLVPPRFETRPHDRIAMAKEDVELECSVHGRPEPRVHWLKNGEALSHNEYLQLVAGANLRILGLMEQDSGVFQCSAVSRAGNVQAAARLTVLPPGSLGDSLPALTPPPIFLSAPAAMAPPPPDAEGGASEPHFSLGGASDVPTAPQALRAVIISTRFVTLSWRPPVTSYGDIITYSVYHRQEGSERERVVNTTGSRLEELNVPGLMPDRPYTFRVVAYNAHGPGRSSDDLTVSTQPEVHVPGPPANLHAVPTSPTSILARWGLPEQSNGPVQRYKLFYMEGDSVEEHHVVTAEQQYELTGLRCYTEYSIWVVAFNQNGPGSSTEELTARTLSDVPSEAPQNITLEPSSSTSVIVRWEPPPKEGRNGIITGYKLRYRKRDRRRGDTVTTAGNRRLYALTGLERRSSYQVRLWALTVNGTGPPTEWFTVETYENDLDEEQVPDQPTQVRGRAMTDTITVSWAPPRDQNIMVRGYTIGWGKGIPDAFIQALDGKTRFYVIENLEPNSEYVISLRASNDLGDGQPAYTSVRTREELPPEPQTPLIPPVGLQAMVLSSSTVVVYWTDTTLSKSQFVTDSRYYTVRYTSTHNSANPRYKLFNATDLNCMIDELRPNTQYEFTVKVLKGRRESPWSMVVMNMTQEAAPSTMPRDLTVVPVDSNPSAVNLNWQPPKQPNGAITGYVILYTEDRSRPDRDWVVEGMVGDKMTVSIARLQPDTLYFFKIQARNAKGYGPFSSTVAFTTGADGSGGADTMVLYIGAGCGLLLLLALCLGLTVVLCRRKSAERSKRGYSKGNVKGTKPGKTNIKPPDLWIHHDQMELKNLEKAHQASSGGGPSSSSATLPRHTGGDYDQDQQARFHQTNSLDKRGYVSSYVAMGATPSSSGAVVVVPPGGPDRPLYPRTQYSISRAHVTLDQSPAENPYSVQGGYDTVQQGGATANPTAGPLQQPPTYSCGQEAGGSGTITKRLQGHPLKSFSVPAPPPQSAPGTPQPKHVVSSVTVRPQVSSSPYKKAGILATVQPPAPKGRAPPSQGPSTSMEETTSRMPQSYSTEELNQEMANLEGLMKDLNAITASEFEC